MDKLALGYAGAIVSALLMLIIGILANFGLYTMGTQHMAEMHIFFSPTFGGIIAGMIEAAVSSFIILYAFGFVYNKFATK